MMLLLSAILLASQAIEPELANGNPFQSTKKFTELIEASLTAINIHHEENHCAATYTIVIELILQVDQHPTDIKVIDPGCEFTKDRAEYIVRRLGYVHRSDFKIVNNPKLYRLNITIETHADAPTN
jgi:hypothetical protein